MPDYSKLNEEQMDVLKKTECLSNKYEWEQIGESNGLVLDKNIAIKVNKN